MILRLLIATICCLGPLSTFAQEIDPKSVIPTSELSDQEKAEFKVIAGKLRCPTCTGLGVLESDAAFSIQIQGIIKKKLKEGKGEAAILDYFMEHYGPWILREPPKTGVNLFAWIFPIILLLAGPLLVWVFVWRKRKTTEKGSIRSTAEIIDEFEAALKSLKEKQA